MKTFLIIALACFCAQQIVQSSPHDDFPLVTWYSSQVAGKGSLEAKLRDRNWSWVKVAGEIEPKSYVLDILEGRLGQPEGRGAIGTVESVVAANDGQQAAMVDFGRGYLVGIFLKELSLVEIIHSRPHDDFPLVTWYSSEVAGKGSLEAKLRDRNWSWVIVAGEIEPKSYVQDILEGRLGQPEGRGAIGQVESVIAADDGRRVAIVDFGRGYVVGIFLTELSLVEIIRN